MSAAPVTKISLSRVHFPVTALGPGRRIGIWFQGCSIQCPGCISVDTWAFRAPTIGVPDLLDTLKPWLDQADGVTLTGGEPFDQPEGLRLLLSGIRDRTSADVLVFSGYEFEAIGQWLANTPRLIDAIITGPYQSSVSQTKSLRGSDNQQLHILTSLGKERFSELDCQAPSSRLDMMMSSDGTIYFAGIPSQGDFKELKSRLENAGHVIMTSEAGGGNESG